MKTKQNINSEPKKQGFLKRHKKALLIITGMVILLLIAGSMLKKNNQDEIYTVKRATITQSFSATGKVQAQTEAVMQFNAPSKVTWLGVKKGDQVRKWQALASLDQRTLVKNLQKAVSLYTTNRWDFEEGKDKYQDTPLTDTVRRILEKNQFSLDRTVLDVEIANIARQEATLISPIAGTVVDDGSLVIGENLSANQLTQKAIHIVDLNTLYFEAEVDEIDYAKVYKDQQVAVVLDAFPNESLPGVVDFIEKQGVESTNGILSIPVDVSFTKTNDKLVTGLNGEAFFTTEEKQNVLAVPNDYINSSGTEHTVMIKYNGKTEKRSVEIGIISESMTEITSGLSEGDIVVKPK